MELQKKIIYFSGLASAISICIAYFADCAEYAFLSNICIGLFSSGVLVLSVAIITFLTEFHNELYQLYCDCLDFSQAAPWGYPIMPGMNFSEYQNKITQAISIYNKGIQFHLVALTSVPRCWQISRIITKLNASTNTLESSLLDANEKMMYCILQDRSFEEFQKNELMINNRETSEAAEAFANAVNDLVTYMKAKKIRKWEDDTDAD